MGRGCSRDRNSLEAVSTLKGLHRDKFHLGATFHRGWRAPPFLEQPALFITGVISRREGDGVSGVGETRKRETRRRRGRNAITAALNLFEVHCATGGGVNGNATSSTSTDHPLVLLPSCCCCCCCHRRRVTASATLFSLCFFRFSPLLPFVSLRLARPTGYNASRATGWLENNRLFSSLFLFFFFFTEGKRAMVPGNLVIAEARFLRCGFGDDFGVVSR